MISVSNWFLVVVMTTHLKSSSVMLNFVPQNLQYSELLLPALWTNFHFYPPSAKIIVNKTEIRNERKKQKQKAEIKTVKEKKREAKRRKESKENKKTKRIK